MKRLLGGRRSPAASISPLFARSFAQGRPPGPARAKKEISSKDKRFLAALQRYRELHGHFLVPSSFVVPSGDLFGDSDASQRDAAAAWPPETWGLELGKRLRTFTRGRGTQFKASMLQSIGFPHQDWRAYVWVEQTLPAMRAFRRIHGHLFVRQGFQVPSQSDRWPRTTWGLKFGAHCQQLRAARSNKQLSREVVEDLERVGFMWSDTQWKWERQLRPALTRFRALFGHAQVPMRFSIPEDDHRWPRELWGFKLGVVVGRTLDDVKLLESPHDERAMMALHDLDFFNEGAAEEAWRDLIFPCLELYSSLHRQGLMHASDGSGEAGDSLSERTDADGADSDSTDTDIEFAAIDIPEDFVVPSDAQWPVRAWRLPLGYIVDRICNSVLFDSQVQAYKQELQRLGYGWEALYSKWTREVLPALRAFQREHGHCDVPANYVVPAKPASSTVSSSAAYRLGKQVAALRRTGRDAPDVADILDHLDAIGFQFDAHESVFLARVLPALRTYVDKYGDCHVPQGFIVPSDDATWPAATRGMKLGHTVRDMRLCHHYGRQMDAHHSELEALGFPWNLYRPARSTAVSIDAELNYWRIYQRIYGSELVPTDFVVPDDDPRWPRKARNFNLGAWLQIYRQRIARAQLTTQHHGEHALVPEQPLRDVQDAVSSDSDGDGTAADAHGDTKANFCDGNSDADADKDDRLKVQEPSASVASVPLRGSGRARQKPPPAAVPVLPPHQEEYWTDVVLASFRAYASLNGGSCRDMDAGYIVPSEEPFPSVAWGLNLGLRLWHIKYGDRYAAEVRAYEADLRALGITVEKPTREADSGKKGVDGEDGRSEVV